MRDVYLHGPLAEQFGRHFRLNVKSPAEAAHALCKLLDGFYEAFVGADYQQQYRVQSAGHDVANASQSTMQRGTGEIHFTPVIAGGAGLLQTILGITLIVAGTFIPGAQFLVPAGIAMTLGGIVQLLSPTQKAQKASDQDDNTVFDGPTNVSAQGNPVPVLLGKGWAGSVVASAGIESVQSDHVDFDPDGGTVTDPDGGDDGDDDNPPRGGYNPYDPRHPVQVRAPMHWLMSGSGRSERDDRGGKTVRVLRGAGGGGKGGGGIKEDGTSARSTALVRVLDVISEGPCGGPVNGLQSMFLNKVPVENPDGSANFIGKFAWRTGTQDQTYIPDFADVDNEVSVAAEVKHGQAVTETITNAVADRARVRLRWPSGMQDSSSGKRITAASVDVMIELQCNGGGFVPMVVTTVHEKTQANYERTWDIPFDGGEAPYDIRVTRLSEDADSSLVVNTFRFESLTEIVDAKLRYPLRALMGSQVPSGQFGSVPPRAFFWWGHLGRVPRNYDSETRTYATTGPGTTNGIWDGTFKLDKTDNPAWILNLVATNKRWGMGNFIGENQVDTWELYKIAQYCDELVDDGKGGTEPRWTFFAYLTKQQAAWKVFDTIVAGFRGNAYWGGGKIVPTQDRPKTPVYTYTNANVVGGQFHREGASLDTKFTRVIAYYHDDDELGARKPVVVDDPKGIERYGIIVKEVDAYTRSRGCAARFARSILAANLTEGDVVTWPVGSPGAVRAPGDVVDIFDNARARTRRGGRLDSATETSATLDAPVTLTDGVAYTLIVIYGGVRSTRGVTTGPGETRVIEVDTPFDPVPPGRDAVWVLTSDEIPAEWIRLTKVGENDDGTYQLTGVRYNGDKYPYIDSAGLLPTEVGKGRIKRPAAPTGITAVERLYTAGDGSTKLVQSLFSWDHQDGVTAYEITLTSSVDTSESRTVIGNSVTWLNIEPGQYTLTMVALTGGLRGIPAIASFDLDGINAPEADFVADDRTPKVGQTVQFTDRSAQLPNAWNWDFGDGAISTDQNPGHVYQAAGTYTVELQAHNNAGDDTLTRTDYIHVSDAAPVAGFTATINGLAVSIVDSHSGGAVTSYEYDWGDGSTSSSAEPGHTYSQAGTYTIKQTVSGPGGTDATTRTVEVSS